MNAFASISFSLQTKPMARVGNRPSFLHKRTQLMLIRLNVIEGIQLTPEWLRSVLQRNSQMFVFSAGTRHGIAPCSESSMDGCGSLIRDNAKGALKG
jgi:hypothetical protein